MYTLQVNRDDLNKSWGKISDGLWKKLLNKFIYLNSDQIGFDGITSSSQIEEFTGFRELDLEMDYSCRVVVSFKNKLGRMLTANYDVGVFAYTSDIHKLMQNIDFNEWNASNDDYPVDELFFFRQDELLVHVTSYEGTIEFYGGLKTLKKLQSLGDEVRQNLHDSTEHCVQIFR